MISLNDFMNGVLWIFKMFKVTSLHIFLFIWYFLNNKKLINQFLSIFLQMSSTPINYYLLYSPLTLMYLPIKSQNNHLLHFETLRAVQEDSKLGSWKCLLGCWAMSTPVSSLAALGYAVEDHGANNPIEVVTQILDCF